MQSPPCALIRVLPRRGRWEVETNGVTRRMIDWLCTKDRAIQHALEQAHDVPERAAKIRIERADGTLEDELDVGERHLAAE